MAARPMKFQLVGLRIVVDDAMVSFSLTKTTLLTAIPFKFFFVSVSKASTVRTATKPSSCRM